MYIDRYAKVVFTFIAIALWGLLISMWIAPQPLAAQGIMPVRIVGPVGSSITGDEVRVTCSNCK